MKELDFDELDKAVNSLMGDLPQTNESSKDNSNTVSAASDTAELSSEGSAVSTLTSSTPARETASPTLPSPASRRGGRFMDVVHPSSDMKTTRMGASSREGVSITPPESSTSEQAAPANDAVAPVKEEVTETVATTEWPDPIALHEEKQADQSQESSVPEQKIEEPASEPVSDTSFTEPLTSPFLADAKVEKRPLGGSAQALDQAMADELGKVETEKPGDTEPQSTAPEEKPTESTPPEPMPQLLTPPAEEKAPLPAELASDLVAIEAGGAATSEQTPEAAPTNPVETSPAPVAIGAGSIPQQYTEQPSTGDESHAAIYDTEAAQQPLMHPPKKKTGWLVIIWIILIIILGIGVGATIWYFGLI